MHGKGATIGGIVVIAVLLAGLGDLLAHPSGTKTLFSGSTGLLKSTYTAAAGKG